MKAKIIEFNINVHQNNDGKLEEAEGLASHGVLFPKKKLMIAIHMSDPELPQHFIWRNWVGGNHYRVIGELAVADELFKLAQQIIAAEDNLLERLRSIYWSKILKPDPKPSEPGQILDEEDDIPF